MMWSLLYSAVSDQYARQELAGKMTDDTLETKLGELRKLNLADLSRRYFDILGKPAPKEEEL